MAEFLTTKGIASKIENIIRKATGNVYLISPYLKLSQSFYERLQDAEEKCVPMHIVYGKDELDKNEWQKIRSLKNIKLYFYKNLHAKCFANEQEMVITTMNMYEYSEHNNREMSISINKNNDIDIYNDAFEEIKSIIKSADIEKDFQMTAPPAAIHAQQSIKATYSLMNHEEYNVSDFHLPLLFESLKQKITKVGVFLKDNQIKIFEYPQPGINLKIDGRIDIDFYSAKYNFEKIKQNNQLKLGSLLPGIRIYWNNPRVMIYTEKEYNVALTPEGRKSKSDKYFDIINTVIDNLEIQ